MSGRKTTSQQLSDVLETVTRKGIPAPETTAYGSWLLGGVSERQRKKKIRVQAILTFVVVATNLIGIGSALLLTVAVPMPSGVARVPGWVTFAVGPVYILVAFALGGAWLTARTTRSLRWAIRGDSPTLADQRNVLVVPWRFALVQLLGWGVWTALLVWVYGAADPVVIPRILFAMDLAGLGVATGCYLLTEFALRPVAARALEAGPPPRRMSSGIMSRTMTGWMITSGVPTVAISLLAIFDLSLRNVSYAQTVVFLVIVTVLTQVFGFILMWILAWLTATPVRVVRAALRRVEDGDLQSDLVVFDGTELGELQRGFNSMVDGLRQRERVRDLFGRHVGREVAAAAERERPKLGGEERHVAVVFIDIIGSTRLVASQRATDVVALLNQFFGVVVAEVDRNHGFVNKFAGDAALAIFGAPNHLDCPEDGAMAAARAMSDRLATEVPELKAGIGVAAGTVVAGNVGANERFEYTVIGEPVNEAARLCELAKSHPGRLLASSRVLHGASENECARWVLGDTVTLRGLDQGTRLASPRLPAEAGA